MAAGLKQLTQLDQAIKHQKVVASTTFLMASITEQLFAQLMLQQGHGSVVHGPSCNTLELKPSKCQGGEVFEPVVAAKPVLRVSLQPAELLP